MRLILKRKNKKRRNLKIPPGKGQELGLGNVAPDDGQFKAMIAKMDLNNDGKVDWDEFKRFFTPSLDK